MKKSCEELNVFDITPIEEYRGILYKRDDLFMPFKDVPLSGGKVRQAITLIHNNYEHIRDECNGMIVSATSVNSPQGIIIAKTAQEFGFKSLLVLGNTNVNSLKSNPLIRRATKFGARVDIKCTQGYESTLMARIYSLGDTRKFYIVKFGINLETNPEAIVDSIAYQVQNIPKDLDILVVPVGSAITFGGILKGLIKYDIRPKRVVGVQIAGYDREDVIRKILGDDDIEYEFYLDKSYAYSRHIKVKFNDTEYLDCVYESKAFDYMMKNIEIQDKKVLFWIVGNSSFVREPI